MSTAISNRKSVIGFVILAILVACVMILPESLGYTPSLSLKLSIIILLSVYVILSFEIIHRTSIALIGAAATVFVGIVTGLFGVDQSFDFVIKSIDFNTIGLLLGMMVIVAVMSSTGVFQYVGARLYKASGGNLWKLLVLISVFTAVASMFIDNVTTILLTIPFTISIFRTLKISPIPFILCQVFASNIGGTATLIGDPPNIMIGSAANIDFTAFIINMIAPIFVALFASLFLMKVMFRKDLAAKPVLVETDSGQKFVVSDKSTLKKSLTIIFAVIALFVVHGALHVAPSIIALGGAGILLGITKIKPDKIFHDVDWNTLLFFAGLFIIIGGVEKAGLMTIIANMIIGVTGGQPWPVFFTMMWSSAIASAFVDNIPFAATMIPTIHVLNQHPSILHFIGNLAISPLWWALSLGVGLGGNGTIIGSSAGVIASGLSEKEGHPISFNKFMKTGMPIMILTIGVGGLILFLQTLLA